MQRLIAVKLQQANVANINNIIYTKDILEEIVKQAKDKSFSSNICPQVSYRNPLSPISPDEVSHIANNIRIEEDYLVCDIKILRTPYGRILEEIMKTTPVTFGVRGLISTNDNNEIERCRLMSIGVSPNNI